MILHPDLPYVPLPYVERLDQRPPEAITLVVIHSTELPDLATAREYGEIVHYADSGTGNSGHFYVDRDGSTQQWVPWNGSRTMFGGTMQAASVSSW